jgi:hypothetical protein
MSDVVEAAISKFKLGMEERGQILEGKIRSTGTIELGGLGVGALSQLPGLRPPPQPA